MAGVLVIVIVGPSVLAVLVGVFVGLAADDVAIGVAVGLGLMWLGSLVISTVLFTEAGAEHRHEQRLSETRLLSMATIGRQEEERRR